MGKYSLDAFEQYPLVKLRPVVMRSRQDSYRLLELSWSELEPAPGELRSPPQIGDGTVLVKPELDAGRDIAEACGFIRRMGSFYDGGTALGGVVLTAGGFSGAAAAELVRAYRQGFASAELLAEPGTELMAVCRKEGISVGLWLPLERGVLDLRRSIARSDLERTWRERPVYVYAGRELNDAELDAACRWHASGADGMTALGVRMTLRRVMFPRDLTSGGAMPLRFWWQNLGSAPMYRDACVRMELRNDAGAYPVSVPGTMRPGLGDTTLNAVAQLPKIPAGTYSLWVGLESGEKLLPLAVDAPEENGMVMIGEITTDDVPRPYLATMWERQYADGYYPLEDPAQPE